MKSQEMCVYQMWRLFMIQKYKVWLRVLTRNGWARMVYRDIVACSYGDACKIASQRAKAAGHHNVRSERVTLQGFE